MTGRPTGPDRWAASPAGAVTVALAVLATITAVAGITAGPRAGLALGGLLVGVPCAAAAVLGALCLMADAARALRHNRARRRTGLDPVDHHARRSDPEA